MERSCRSDLPESQIQKYKSRRLREAYVFLKGFSNTREGNQNIPVNIKNDVESISKDLFISQDEDLLQLVATTQTKKPHLVHSASVTSSINVEDEIKRGRTETDHSIRDSFTSNVLRSKSNVETNREYQINNLVKISNSDNLKVGDKELHKRRIVFTAHSQAPLLLLSIIPYKKKIYHEKRTSSMVVHHSHVYGGNFIENIEFNSVGKLEVSYSHLLLPERWKKKISDSQDVFEEENLSLENDNILLDDPGLTSGKHRTVLNLTSFITSIIAYAKPSEVKKDINEQFKEQYPHVTITLTKLRSIKGELLEIASKTSMDPAVLAISYFYFERVVLKTRITKQNRKCIAGACMLLSIKFFDDFQSKNIKGIIEAICDQLRLNEKDLLSCELQVLILLEFNLIIRFQDISDTFKRLESFLA